MGSNLRERHSSGGSLRLTATVVFRLIFACFLGGLVWPPPRAQARFQHLDAELIDREEEAGSEYYNDLLSYRWPAFWQELWARGGNGFRVQTASLTVNRAYFLEEIRLHSGREAAWGVGLDAWREEEMIEQFSHQQVRIDVRPVAAWRFSLLGAGGTYKKWGDLGLAAGWGVGPNLELRFTYWSVDHYYNSKSGDEADRFLSRPQTIIVDGHWRNIGAWEVRGSVEVDTPLRWQHGAGGYFYGYERTLVDAQLSFPATAGRWQFRWRYDEKMESKSWMDGAGSSKMMQRQVQSQEVSWQDPEAHIQMGLISWQRDARYEHAGDLAANPSLDARYSPSSRWREAALFATWMRRAAATWMQHGTYINAVQRQKDEKSRSDIEAKYQFMWGWHLDSDILLALNTTWDLDQLAQDFPYQSQPFRPWGGGSLQIQCTF